MVAKLLLGTIVAAIALGVLSVLAIQTTSADPVGRKATVNTTSNHPPDADLCEGLPNTGSGDCTLGEAIIETNLGRVDIINFRANIFSKQTPGVIFIDDDVAGNEGCLPPITEEVVIDSTGAGVILDGDANNDGDAEDCSFDDQEGVIQVFSSSNGFDFSLIGAKNFIIREFDGETDGINLDGSTNGIEHAFNEVIITGYIFQDGDVSEVPGHYDSDDGIDFDEIDKVINGTFTNNNITADDDGIEIDAQGEKDCAAGGGQVAGALAACRKIASSTILINQNTIIAEHDEDSGEGDGVDIEYEAHLNGKILIEVIDNPSITSLEGDAVDIEYCADSGDCNAGGSEINIDVSRNNKLHGGEGNDGEDDQCVEIDIDADDGGINAGETHVDVGINDNGLCDAGGHHGYDVDIDICCDASFSSSTVNINGNDDVIADNDAAHVDVDIGCGDGNESFVSVSENGSLEGQDDDGVRIDVEVGETATDCGVEDAASDKNHSTIKVNNNHRIDGGGDEGVEVDANVGTDGGDGDDNENIVEVNGNGIIHGETDGVEVDLFTGSDSGDEEDRGDNNLSKISINGNDDITGDDEDGVEVDATAGGDPGNGDGNENTVDVNDNGAIHGDDEGIDVDIVSGSSDGITADDNLAKVTIDGNDDIDGSDGEGIEIDADSGVEDGEDNGINDLPTNLDDEASDADDNLTQVFITDNGNIEGNDDDGIEIDVQSGGGSRSASSNANEVTITGNGEIIGRNDAAGDGMDVDMEVCCSSQGAQGGTNTLLIGENGDIIGRDDDGINIDLCCAGTNVVSILDNGTIRGNDGDGIDYDVDVWTNFKTKADLDFDEPCPAECGVFNMVNMLTIRGNHIFNSEEDGIEIAYGAFQFPTEGVDAGTVLKSLITENEIDHNRDHGIELHSTTGINIIDNEIHHNGDDPQVDRGIEIDTDGFGDFVQGNLGEQCEPGDDPTALPCSIIAEFPANMNLISKNSIYDNLGLGIELEGDTDGDGDGDHGIGCVLFGALPSPNDCIAFPVIQTMSGLKVSGDACAGCVVELFLADADPADQLPLVPQHGEGKTYIARGSANTLGDWSIQIPCGLGAGLLTATATNNKDKSTSEFSRNFELLDKPCTPTPTVTHTPTNTVPPPATATPIVVVVTATPELAKACGDVNDDGAVNAIDAQLVLQFKAALIPALINPPSADVNGDGNITSVDAALILQKEAGLIPALTGC